MRFVMTLSVMILLALLQFVPATASIAGTPAPEAPARSAGLGIRLLDVPAETQNDPRARTYIIDRLAPGTEITRRIKVENNTGTQQTVRLYAGAARIDGGVFVGDNAGVDNELSTWTTVERPEVALESGQAAEIPVTISVPADAAESEQYAAVWAEMRSAADKGGVVQANRVGIRIYLSVGPGNGAPANFSITSLTPSRSPEGAPQLSALVTNTGGRALDITGNLELRSGPGGLSAGPFTVQKATTVAPGNTQRITFTLPREVPNGPWTAEIRLKSGLLERETSSPVTFPDAGPGDTLTPAQDERNPWIWAAAGTALLVLIAATLLLKGNKRVRDAVTEDDERHPGAAARRRVRERA